MGWDCVEINRLSGAGDSKRRIRCLARHVTVFRATNSSDLDVFAAALRGEQTMDRFSILLDGTEWSPSQHTLIGFGEVFSSDDTRTVEQYLSEYGAEANNESLLLRAGLGGLRRFRVTELSAAQGHTLRLLAAMHDSSRVLVLKEPFADVPDSWRETLAEMLSAFAWNKHAVVIVTHLSFRPKAWIENEVISRVQVERPRQATIGFGGSAAEAEVIKAIRADLGGAGEPGKKGYTLIPPKGNPPFRRVVGLPLWVGLGMAAFSAVAIVVLAVFLNSNVYSPASTMVADSALKLTDSHGAPIVGGQVHTDEMVAPGHPEQPNSVQPKASLLERYPAEVKEAVLLAFNKPEDSVKLWYQAAQLRPVAARPIPAGRAAPEYNKPAQQDEGLDGDRDSDRELEARREEIRRRFLEAIQGQR